MKKIIFLFIIFLPSLAFTQLEYNQEFKIVLHNTSPEVVNSFKNFIKNLYYYQINITSEQSNNTTIFYVKPSYLKEDILYYLSSFSELSREFSVSITSNSNILIRPYFSDKKVFFIELYNFILKLKTEYKKPEIALSLIKFFQKEVRKQNREVYYDLKDKIEEVKTEIEEEVELLREFKDKLNIFEYGNIEKSDLYNFIKNNYDYLLRKLDDLNAINNLQSNLTPFTANKVYLEVDIPEERGYINTGLDSPVCVKLYYLYNGTRIYIKNAPVLIENVERDDFKKIIFSDSEYGYPDDKILVFTDDDGIASFYIKAFADFTNNKFKITTGYFYDTDEILDYLAGIVSFDKDKIKKNLFYSKEFNLPDPYDSYSEYYSQYQPEELNPVSAKIKNKYISVAVNSDGQFTIGAEDFPYSENGKMDMLFGHPNGVSAEGIWSSFTTIKYNDVLYKFHNLETVDFKTNKNKIIITKKLDKILISQILTITNQPGYTNKNSCKITYKITNTDNTESVYAGIRIMLDTWAGFNDGVPFRLPLYDYESENEIIVNEYDVPTINMGEWECYEAIDEKRTVILSGNLIAGNIIYPDRFVMAKWPKIYDTMWDYEINSEEYITGDSAVAVWWYPREVLPDASISFHIFYGLKEIRESILQPQVVWDFNNPFLISFVKKNDSEEDKFWQVKVISVPENIQLYPGEPSLKAKTVAPEKEEKITFKFIALNNTVPNPVIKFKEIYNNTSKIKKVRIRIFSRNGLLSVPVINSIYKPIVITYSPDRENKPKQNEYLVAALVDDEGNYLKKVVLYDDGGHNDNLPGDNVYGNKMMVRHNYGQYKIVIYKVKLR